MQFDQHKHFFGCSVCLHEAPTTIEDNLLKKLRTKITSFDAAINANYKQCVKQ